MILAPLLLVAASVQCGRSSHTPFGTGDQDPDNTGSNASTCSDIKPCPTGACIAGTCFSDTELTCPNGPGITTVGACIPNNTYDLGGNPNDHVNIASSDGALVIDTSKTTHSYIWITNTPENTISKINTKTLKEEGRYHTGGVEPSRTSVDLYGNAYVGHRGISRVVTKISPLGEDCPNHNGKTKTFKKGTAPLPFGRDKCVLWSTTLPDSSGGSRSVAAQHVTTLDGNTSVLWVGNYRGRKLHKLDGDTGKILLTVTPPVLPYGLALDKKGNLWMAEEGAPYFGRVDTHRCVDTTCDDNICSGTGVPGNNSASNDACIMEKILVASSNPYGITVDHKQRVWMGGFPHVTRYDPSLPLQNRFAYVKNITRTHGIAADSEGRIWAAAGTSGLLEIDGDSATKQNYLRDTVGNFNKGVAVDTQGKVWSITRDTNTAVVTPGTGGRHKVDTTSVNYVNRPYTYSDMTGQQLALASHAHGYYRHTFESCLSDGAAWSELHWSANLPQHTRISFRVRTSTSRADLATKPWIPLGASPPTESPWPLGSSTPLDPQAQYLEIEVDLERLDTQSATPRLHTFGVSQTGCTPRLL